MVLMHFSIPRASCRSNHYVNKVGAYHIFSIRTLNPPNAFPRLEKCPFFSIRVDPSGPITPQSGLCVMSFVVVNGIVHLVRMLARSW